MVASHPRKLTWLLILAMAWTAVWCCCTPPAQAEARHPVRSCCVARQNRPACPGRTPADCPIDHVRQTSVAPTTPDLPDARPTLCLPPVVVLAPLAIGPAVDVVRPVETADPPGPPPTLLALHTSLVW